MMRMIKPQKLLLTFILVCFLLTCTGCSYMFRISIRGDDPFHPVFVLTKPRSLTPWGKRVPLNSFDVVTKRDGQWDYYDPVWKFRFPLGSYRKVRKITYGKVPKGFFLDTPPQTLEVGREYYVLGSGAGCVGGVSFKIIEDSPGHFRVVMTDY